MSSRSLCRSNEGFAQNFPDVDEERCLNEGFNVVATKTNAYAQIAMESLRGRLRRRSPLPLSMCDLRWRTASEGAGLNSPVGVASKIGSEICQELAAAAGELQETKSVAFFS